MTCPYCNAPDARCLKTYPPESVPPRYRPFGGAVRRRECQNPKCGRRFVSVEILREHLDQLIKLAKQTED